jgi:hypothetical protein
MVVRRSDLPASTPPAGPSLITILGWLVFLYLIDLQIHRMDLPVGVPLASKAAATILGIGGIVLWLARATRGDTVLPRPLFFRRFAALAVVVVAINATWHFFRAWMPLFLRDAHGYSVEDYQFFSMGYYLATDIGSLAAGFATFLLARAGMSVHGSRVAVFAACGLLTTLSVAAALLPTGPLLIAVLFIVGFGALGVFPSYYSFSQDLTVEHQGKLTGALGCICWLAMALVHEAVGDMVKQTGSYTYGVACAGFLPLVGLVMLLLLWGRTPQREPVPVEKQKQQQPYTDGIRLPPEASVVPRIEGVSEP